MNIQGINIKNRVYHYLYVNLIANMTFPVTAQKLFSIKTHKIILLVLIPLAYAVMFIKSIIRYVCKVYSKIGLETLDQNV